MEIHAGHNTYLVVGAGEELVPSVCATIESTLAVSTRGNPDFWHETYMQFTIDDSRTLKALQSTKPFGKRRVIIVETVTMTTDAQQAILKLAEELTGNIYFFIILPNAEQLLPTLRSRFVHIKAKGAAEESEGAQKFLGSTWDKRTKMIELITKEKDKKAAYALLSGIERELEKDKKKHATAISAVLDGKRRVLEGIVPLKNTLESVALQLPRVSLK